MKGKNLLEVFLLEEVYPPDIRSALIGIADVYGEEFRVEFR